MRLDPHSNDERIVNEAARRAINTAAPSRFSGANSGFGEVRAPGTFTTPHTLDDGSIGSNHVFALELDLLADETAFLQVPDGDF